ncbi:metal ABC transporter substrate-binding protein, partial [Achromobacter sp. SIMBA_011]
MNKNKRTLIAAGLASLTLVAGLFGPLASTAQAAQTLRVGIMSGEDEDVWRVVAANAA